MSDLFDKARQFLMRRRWAYQSTFRAPSAQAVLADLAKFCRADKTTFHKDERASVLLEGRREVWLRIAEHLHMPADALYIKYTTPPDSE